MKELLFMKPVFKEAVWGGKKLREDFGYEIQGDDTGECWGIGANKNGDCLEMRMEGMGKNFRSLLRSLTQDQT